VPLDARTRVAPRESHRRALARFELARSQLTEVGAEHEVQDIDSRVANVDCSRATPKGARAIGEILGWWRCRGRSSASRHLHRVRGYAMLVGMDPFGAR
jgi:hypothetical protein